MRLSFDGGGSFGEEEDLLDLRQAGESRDIDNMGGTVWLGKNLHSFAAVGRYLRRENSLFSFFHRDWCLSGGVVCLARKPVQPSTGNSVMDKDRQD